MEDFNNRAKLYSTLVCHLVPILDFHVGPDTPMAWPFKMPGEEFVGGEPVVKRMVSILRRSWSFNPHNPTGRYQLDMSNRYDHFLMMRLMEVFF